MFELTVIEELKAQVVVRLFCVNFKQKQCMWRE